jgi:predicted nucleic acid-binding protein
MRETFADSFFFFALLDDRDLKNAEANAFIEDFDGRLFTTEWVLTEVADGFAISRDRLRFLEFYRMLCEDPSVSIVESDPGLFRDGMQLYSKRADKDWSLTDCISFTVMKRRALTEALTGDHHFEQAGFKALLK